jgi:hypothetical protein
MTSLIQQLQDRIKNLERATDSANLVSPKIYPPVTTAALESAEKMLGFALPVTLRQIYLQVGNGGFGPGYGLLGLPGGATDDLGENVVSLYQGYHQSNPDDPYWDWPQRLLPLCYLGCAMYASVDCNTTEGVMIWFEPNPHQDGKTWDDAFIPLAPSIDAWLQAWLEGKALLQDAMKRVANEDR